MTISLCMIVKDEEAVLARCLDSVADLVDEIVIVDTGSTDKTKEIAARYTSNIYDFQWVNDFSAARNFAFSKCTMEYIYSADADEILDEENRQRFMDLKEFMLPEIDIVQMKYGNQLENGTVYNFDEEYRPKLFKRLRTFTWVEPIHETVRLDPVVFDSDIVITHAPTENHGDRDLHHFRRLVRNGVNLSKHLHNMYARELFLVGTDEDFRKAYGFFTTSVQDLERGEDEHKEACLVAARAARIAESHIPFFKYITKLMANDAPSEACIELGLFYESIGDYEEAAVWYYNAAFETTPILRLAAANEDAAEGLTRVYRSMGVPEVADTFVRDIEKRIREMK